MNIPRTVIRLDKGNGRFTGVSESPFFAMAHSQPDAYDADFASKLPCDEEPKFTEYTF
jgi:hypothetical protein